MAQTFGEWRRDNSGTRADYENYLTEQTLAAERANRQTGIGLTDVPDQGESPPASAPAHLAVAEHYLDEADMHEPGSSGQLGLSVLALAHVMTALLRDTLQPGDPAPRITPAWNVIARVRAVVTAGDAETAIARLAERLRRQGFAPMEDHGDGYHCAQPAGDGTWATVVSVVDVLRAPSGYDARRQLTGALATARFTFDSRVQPSDIFLSEDGALA